MVPPRLLFTFLFLVGFIFGADAPVGRWIPYSVPRANADGFVAISGGTFIEGDVDPANPLAKQLTVEDFEIGQCHVTNAEYAAFVRATGHEAPQHWDGTVPRPGQESFPVTFVNRYDALAYVAWISQREHRAYRLPSRAEFEYAARGGLVGKRFPWGDEPPAGKANYDAAGDRDFGQFERHLLLVKSFPVNGYGLHDMAGNAWHWVDAMEDPIRSQNKFRITSPADIERLVMGGSWARREFYLRNGANSSVYPGLRHPDIGFRLVREPQAGAPGFNTTVRRLAVVSQGPGKVFVSWQLLPADTRETRFNVYRTTVRYSAGERLNAEPLSGGTNFVDENAKNGALTYYRVRPVDAAGREGFSSEWSDAVTPGTVSNLIASFVPLPRSGDMLPAFGDLDGDGLFDAVIRFSNGHKEATPDPGVPVEIEAYAHGGRFIWRKALMSHRNSYGNFNNVPMVVYDVDGDGRDEVACRYEENGEVFLAVLDGLTGDVRHKTSWPPLLTDFARSSSRVFLAVAYLDGKTPSLITQNGLYENEVITAYDPQLKKRWEYRSTGSTSGSGSHRIDVADVDGDGRDEIIIGSMCLNADGSLRWSIYRQHADFAVVRDFLPDRPGREVFYAVETMTHAGVYLVEAESGRIIWKHNREDDPVWFHVHQAWCADILPSSPGIEIHAAQNRGPTSWLFQPTGEALPVPLPRDVHWPVEWDGQPGREIIHRQTKSIAHFDGKNFTALPEGSLALDGMTGNLPMVADLAGDFRDELVVVGNYKDQRGVFVLTPATRSETRDYTRTSDREYRLWLARNLTAGYGTYFESSHPQRPQLK